MWSKGLRSQGHSEEEVALRPEQQARQLGRRRGWGLAQRSSLPTQCSFDSAGFLRVVHPLWYDDDDNSLSIYSVPATTISTLNLLSHLVLPIIP